VESTRLSITAHQARLAAGGAVAGICVALLVSGARSTSGGTMPLRRAAADCEHDSAYRVLDFWLGDWSVTSTGDTAVARDVVEKVQDGCAITEVWDDGPRDRGQSLFYYLPSARQWRQVWVTNRAFDFGGTKEKRLVWHGANGGVRFQGELLRPDGTLVLDRSTITPMSDGRVHYTIEVSTDGGTSWRTPFDATFTKRRGSAASRPQ
jgi:hypothetical protein